MLFSGRTEHALRRGNKQSESLPRSVPKKGAVEARYTDSNLPTQSGIAELSSHDRETLQNQLELNAKFCYRKQTHRDDDIRGAIPVSKQAVFQASCPLELRNPMLGRRTDFSWHLALVRRRTISVLLSYITSHISRQQRRLTCQKLDRETPRVTWRLSIFHNASPFDHDVPEPIIRTDFARINTPARKTYDEPWTRA